MGVSSDSLALPLAFSICSYCATNAHIHDAYLEKDPLKTCRAKTVSNNCKIKTKESIYAYQ